MEHLVAPGIAHYAQKRQGHPFRQVKSTAKEEKADMQAYNNNDAG